MQPRVDNPKNHSITTDYWIDSSTRQPIYRINVSKIVSVSIEVKVNGLDNAMDIQQKVNKATQEAIEELDKK